MLNSRSFLRDWLCVINVGNRDLNRILTFRQQTEMGRVGQRLQDAPQEHGAWGTTGLGLGGCLSGPGPGEARGPGGDSFLGSASQEQACDVSELALRPPSSCTLRSRGLPTARLCCRAGI